MRVVCRAPAGSSLACSLASGCWALVERPLPHPHPHPHPHWSATAASHCRPQPSRDTPPHTHTRHHPACRLPLYYELKLAYVIALWHPQTKFALTVYGKVLAPFLQQRSFQGPSSQ